MEMEPAGPSVKKMKLVARDTHEAMPAATEGHDPNPPTTTVRSHEPPPSDHISDLPDAVLGEIITLLPIKDGARTQAFASRWRHLWRSAPLNLDFRGLHADRERREALLGVVLSAHQGSGRRLCLPAPYLQYQEDAADALPRSPALVNLQELELYVAAFDNRSPQPSLLLPESIFRFSSTLRVATIGQSELPDYMVETLRFPQLRMLALMSVIISECALGNIIAGCPILESLLLDTIFRVGCLRINSPTLRNIGIRFAAAELIIEDAPLLQRLLNLDLYYMQKQILVISAPKLETLGCISELSSASKIVFGSTIIQGLHISSLTTVVRNVKILGISILCFDLDMVIDLMRCFPCLEKLYIKRGQSGKPNLWRRKHRNLLRSLDIRLKTIVMGCYRGIKAQANFAQFFVLNARILESLKLEVEHCNHNDEFFAEQHRMLQMEKRASRGARLCFAARCRHDVPGIMHVSDLDLTDPFACGC